MIVGLGLSPRLWTTERVFPLIPAFSWVPAVPSAVHFALLLLLLGATTLLLLGPRARGHGLAIGALVGLVALDLNRLQPWVYEYGLLLWALGYGLRHGRPEAREVGWRLAALIVASTYLWSGLHKFSTGFETHVFPNLIRRFTPYLGAADVPPASWLRIAAPWLEAGIGLSLLLPRLRRFGVAGAWAMHLLILVAIGPLGNNDNTVVWPWNLASAALCGVLFLRHSSPVFPAIWFRSGWAGPALFTLCGLMPALNLVDLWDSYLSASLYSGRRWDAAIRLSPAAATSMPKEVMVYARRTEEGYALHLTSWCMAELNVPLYPEPRAFRAVGRELAARAGHPAGLRLLAEAPPGWRSRERPIIELEY